MALLTKPLREAETSSTPGSQLSKNCAVAFFVAVVVAVTVGVREGVGVSLGLAAAPQVGAPAPDFTEKLMWPEFMPAQQAESVAIFHLEAAR